MTIKRMDNVGIVVEDIDTVISFFTAVRVADRPNGRPTVRITASAPAEPAEVSPSIGSTRAEAAAEPLPHILDDFDAI